MICRGLQTLVLDLGVNSLSIVRLAVNAVVLDEAGGLSVQSELTYTASQTVRVPGSTVHLKQVLVCDRL